MISVSLVLVTAACTTTPRSEPGARVGSASDQPLIKQRIVAAIVGEPPGLSMLRTNPTRTIGFLPGMDELHDLVHAGLISVDNGGALHPLLAESVPTAENGLWTVFPDGRMETTWRIKPNATWHDGTPFTADDLLFTLQIEQDKELPFFHSPTLDLIEDARAPDRTTFTVRWKSPFIEADTMFTAALAIPAPRHLLEESYRDNRGGFIELPYWSESFVGTGPFRVREWVSGSHASLVANDGYVLGRPRIDEVEVRFIQDINAVVASLLAGSVQLTLGRGVDLEQAMLFVDQRPDIRVLFSSGSMTTAYPQFVEPNPAVIADVRFRRALLSALDRQDLSDVFTRGMSPLAQSIVHPTRAEYAEVEPSIVRYEYDPRRSAQVFEELGFTRGPDGFYIDTSSQKLSVELRTIYIQERQRTMLTVADAWQRVGVAVEPVVIPPQRATDRPYRAAFPGFEIVGARNDLTSARLKLFHSSMVPLAENRYQANGNNARYMNPALDSLVDRYITTIPRQERTRTLAQIVRHQTENVSLMGLFYSLAPTVMTARLQNVSRGEDNNVVWNAHEWELK
jgi:peptide/nickel transport system substrate-binding protein